MPDFLIIGAMKCGTTSLYKYLVQHPQIDEATKKEIHYFDFKSHRSILWYESHFRWGRLVRRLLGRVTGEATPYYLFHSGVPGRVFSAYPRVRLITLLRDPVERAYSHYHHNVRKNKETLDFETALDMEEERTRPKPDGKGNEDSALNRVRYSYQARGIYVDQLIRWHATFPREQMLVLFFEDFLKDPAAATRKVTEFLGLKPHDHNTEKVYNSNKYEQMRPETWERLAEFYRPHNLRLTEYLGCSLPWK